MPNIIFLLITMITLPAFAQPLLLSQVAQYDCIEGGQVTHYFFEQAVAPPALPWPGSRGLYCHDILRYGEDDSPQFPRLNLQNNMLTLWAHQDRRFEDQDGNNSYDIHDQMEADLRYYYGINARVRLFLKVKMKNSPIADRANVPYLGTILSYFVKNQTGVSICPDRSYYNSNMPMFRVLGQYLERDTEAVYLGVEEGTSRNESDKVIIREGILRQIALRFGNSPYDDIYFHYPADIYNPRNRQPGQKLYRVRRPSDVQMGDQLGNPTLLSHDKRFGCIPK
jgi:hypothetical protein